MAGRKGEAKEAQPSEGAACVLQHARVRVGGAVPLMTLLCLSASSWIALTISAFFTPVQVDPRTTLLSNMMFAGGLCRAKSDVREAEGMPVSHPISHRIRFETGSEDSYAGYVT